MTELLSILASLALVIPGDGDSQTNAPPGALTFPWSCVGYWQGCTGTIITPHHFITATHVGGTLGDFFYLPRGDGTFERYMVMNHWRDEFSDLSVWLVMGTFTNYVTLNADSRLGNSTNALLIGNGMFRGPPVYAETWTTNGITLCGTRVESPIPSVRLAGYEWSWPRGQIRWGVNPIMEAPSGFVMMPFVSAGYANGDSGGPVFIERGGMWLLAGIAYGVSGCGPYTTHPNEDPDGTAMPACYWNFADLYSHSFKWPNNGVYATTGVATAIAPRWNWIVGILDL